MSCEQASDCYGTWGVNPNTPTETTSSTKITSTSQNSRGLMMTGHSRARSLVVFRMRLPIFTLPKC